MHAADRVLPVLAAEVPAEGQAKQGEDLIEIVASHLRRVSGPIYDIEAGPARLPHAVDRTSGQFPAPGAPLFQASTADLNPWTEAKVN